MLKRVTSRSSVASDRPPSYRTVAPSTSSASPPPPFSSSSPPTFPSSYKVAGRNASFVRIEQLKQHLLLLAAFKRLRELVEADSGVGDELKKLPPETRWAVFVAMAVWRWELFLTQIVAQGGMKDGRHLPPLDVALVWHTNQLNPIRWEEDALRLFPMIKTSLHGQLLGRLRINPETLKQIVYTDTVAEWEGRTGMPYDALLNFRQSTGRHITIPTANEEEKSLFVPWITSNGTGYAQQGFEHADSNGQVWSHASLGVFKLVKDILNCRDDKNATLAGTVVAPDCRPHKPIDSRRAQNARRLIAAEERDVKPAASAYELGTRLGWRKGGAWLILWRALSMKNEQAIKHILSCYTRGEPFSLDLQAAVLRQGTFIDKMHSLGWLDIGRFANDETTLHRCIARYHGFMDLLSAERSMFAVPTLDIDLAWHTHQLLRYYKSDCVGFTGRFIDHSDKVEENALSTSFDATARAWQARFGVPYSTCGCPLPPLRSFSSLLGRFGVNSSSAPTPPPASSTALVPSPSDPSSTEATHPSEHNSLLLTSHTVATKMRAERVAALDSRRRKEAKEAEKEDKRREKGKGKQVEGVLPPIDELQVTEKGETNETEIPAKAEKARHFGLAGDPAHVAAFFAPIPLNPVYGPSGYPIPVGGCASSEVNVSGKYTVESGSVPSAACMSGLEVGICPTVGGICASYAHVPSRGGCSGGGGGFSGCGTSGCGGGGGGG